MPHKSRAPMTPPARRQRLRTHQNRALETIAGARGINPKAPCTQPLYRRVVHQQAHHGLRKKTIGEKRMTGQRKTIGPKKTFGEQMIAGARIRATKMTSG